MVIIVVESSLFFAYSWIYADSHFMGGNLEIGGSYFDQNTIFFLAYFYALLSAMTAMVTSIVAANVAIKAIEDFKCSFASKLYLNFNNFHLLVPGAKR